MAAALGLALAVAAAHAGSVLPLGCDRPLQIDASQQDRLLRFAAVVREQLAGSGSAAALIYAYLVRFLSVALQTVGAGLAKVKPSMEDAARSLGLSPRQVLATGSAALLLETNLSSPSQAYVLRPSDNRLPFASWVRITPSCCVA